MDTYDCLLQLKSTRTSLLGHWLFGSLLDDWLFDDLFDGLGGYRLFLLGNSLGSNGTSGESRRSKG